LVALLCVWLHFQGLRRVTLMQLANRCRPIVGEVVLVGNEEDPIILGLVAQLGPQGVRPEVGAI
jgi:hypothetical protein